MVSTTETILGRLLRLKRCTLQKTYNRALQSLVISKRIQDALGQGHPVVCLESTIITHGMSYPENLAMAKAVEKIVEDNGAIPATIAVINGQARVGLGADDLEHLARTGQQARKISRRDLASAIAEKATGGTTVSGTMILAKKAGISVFVTGGIGGVHRDAESTMDISNDLEELSRNDCAVICAGPKAILDIPRTLEYLETRGVTVTTIGQRNLPAFYSRDSGIPSPQMCKSPQEAAALILANRQLELGSSILICVPIPEESSFDSEEMNAAIDQAVKKAGLLGIGGKDMTPFLLQNIADLTQGRSLASNVALVKENARVGAQIACHLTQQSARDETNDLLDQCLTEENPRPKMETDAKVEHNAYSKGSLAFNNTDTCLTKPSQADVLVIGAVALDTLSNIPTTALSRPTLLRTSHPGTTTRSVGGVAGNIARAIAQTGTAVMLVSMVGGTEDRACSDASAILTRLRQDRVQSQISSFAGARTATYTSVQTDGELLIAVADMDIFYEKELALEPIARRKFKAIIFDANIPTAFRDVRKAKIDADILCFEPTSVPKSRVFVRNLLLEESLVSSVQLWPANLITMITPNLLELQAMFESAQSEGLFETSNWWSVINALDISSTFRSKIEHFLRSGKGLANLREIGAIQQAVHLLPLVENIYLTLGDSGVVSFHLRKDQDVSCHTEHMLIQTGSEVVLQISYHPPVELSGAIISDTGCGDTFTGVLVSALIRGKNISDSVHLAQRAAILTLQNQDSVSREITKLIF